MSDYLTNLARRSIGLAPLVAPRAPPAPFVPEVVAEVPAAVATSAARPAVEPPVARAATTTPAQVQVHAMHVPAGVQVPAAAPPVEPLRVEVHERVLESVVPEPARIETILMPAMAVPGAQAARPMSESAPARATVTQLVTQSVPVPAERPAPDLPAPMVLPARAEPPPVDEPAPREVMPFETVRELTQRFERIIEPAAAVIPPAALPLAPAAMPVTQRVPEMSAAENRIVQVRIGAIEIHAATAPAPAPVAAATASRVASGGFERFTRLRSYAQWEW